MKLLTVILSWQIALTLFGADVVDEALLSTRHTNSVPLIAGPNDANIAKITAKILEGSHYLKQPLNDEISSKFWGRYLDALDGMHIYFQQTDLKEFEPYRTRLDDLTKDGDTDPARVIFTRFLERLQQQFDYVNQLLKTEKFEFKGEDRFVVNRRTLPRPKDMTEAKELWRDRLRYEYLTEKLNLRPEVIANIVLEKLNQKRPKEVVAAIQDKLSKEKAEEIGKIVLQKAGKEKPEAIAKFITTKLEKENAEEIVKIIARRYARILRALREWDNDDVMQIYLTALAHVYDPHSDYMGKSELENFSIGMKLSLFGIGALLRSEDGYCKIQSLVPGGPADRSKKLKANDKIIAVAQGNQPLVDVVDMKLNKVVELIRGPKDTEVRLTIIPGDASDPSVRKSVALIREEIKLEDQEAKAKIMELPDSNGKPLRLGLIDLPSFYAGFELEGRRPGTEQKSTTTDVARLLKKLVQENVAGVILDLRRNGGGSLEEAINLTGLFIKEGPVVQVKDSDGKIFIDNDQDSTVAYEGPLIVLTSRLSASASEILAGALQDYGRALIVGDSSTHGKGTVQSLVQLAPLMRGRMALASASNPGAVKVTIRKFYRASGSSTQLKGVTPDIVLPSIYNHAEIGEASLDNPLAWDTILSASYEKLTRVEPYLAEVKKRSEARIAADKDFAYLKEEIERFKKSQAEKSVSMNEAVRLKEKQEAEERAKERKKELAARPEPPDKVYELTLKQADLPGLPPPAPKTNHVFGASTTDVPATGVPSTKTQEPPPTTNDIRGGKTSPETSPKTDDDSEEASADDKIFPVDITLDETKRILMDYISLSLNQDSLAGTRALEKK